jgi:four helix bundle protein
MYKTFKEMPIWNSAINISEDIFSLTKVLPRSEDYELTSQIRRSALSISANIAESFGRNSTKEKIQFYYISRGSIMETLSHLEYGSRVGYFDDVSQIEEKLNSIHHDINKMIFALKSKPKP